MKTSLAGKVALVAGATRGAGRGIAVQLGAAGATVYVTGRTTRSERSEMNRPETIEETAALVDEAGGRGIAVQVDHLVPGEVSALVTRIKDEQGCLHVLVNNIWGATKMEWNKSVWESSLDYGLRTLRLAVDTHAITSHFAIPLLIKTPGGLVVEVTDGTDEYNATNYRVSFFYDLAKASVNRMAFALAHELELYGATAVSLTPGWLRSEAMLEAYGVAEANWRDATKIQPHFVISESPACVVAMIVSLTRWDKPGAVYLLVGSALYLVATFLVTVVFNVPLNNSLAAVAPLDRDSAQQWDNYLGRWTAWNHVRTAAALAAAALFTIAPCY